MKPRVFLIFIALLFAVALIASATEPADRAEQENRKEDYFEISQGNRVDLPNDMKFERVSNNVIKREQDVTYFARKIEAVEAKVDALSEMTLKRFKEVTEELNAIRTEIGKIAKHSVKVY